MKLMTSCICPPIPYRGWDWEAYDDEQMSGVCGDPECNCKRGLIRGFGATEEEAVIAFVWVLLEMNDISVSELMA